MYRKIQQQMSFCQRFLQRILHGSDQNGGVGTGGGDVYYINPILRRHTHKNPCVYVIIRDIKSTLESRSSTFFNVSFDRCCFSRVYYSKIKKLNWFLNWRCGTRFRATQWPRIQDEVALHGADSDNCACPPAHFDGLIRALLVSMLPSMTSD